MNQIVDACYIPLHFLSLLPLLGDHLWLFIKFCSLIATVLPWYIHSHVLIRHKKHAILNIIRWLSSFYGRRIWLILHASLKILAAYPLDLLIHWLWSATSFFHKSSLLRTFYNSHCLQLCLSYAKSWRLLLVPSELIQTRTTLCLCVYVTEHCRLLLLKKCTGRLWLYYLWGILKYLFYEAVVLAD